MHWRLFSNRCPPHSKAVCYYFLPQVIPHIIMAVVCIQSVLTNCHTSFLHTESVMILQFPKSMLKHFGKFLIGFRPRDWDGHGRPFILCSETHFCVDFDVCLFVFLDRCPDGNPIIRFWFLLSVAIWFCDEENRPTTPVYLIVSRGVEMNRCIDASQCKREQLSNRP